MNYFQILKSMFGLKLQHVNRHLGSSLCRQGRWIQELGGLL